MKKTLLYVTTALLVGSLTITSCSKKAKEESKEATEAITEDVKDGAEKTGDAIKDAATDVKEGAQDVASDVKDAAKETATDIKDATKEAVTAVDAKVLNLGKSARIQYDALDNEIKRIDGEISKASDAQKIKLEKTKANLIKKRDELLNK
jgi:DNA-binding TFAR19-related protein (PDSD5 family)